MIYTGYMIYCFVHYFDDATILFLRASALRRGAPKTFGRELFSFGGTHRDFLPHPSSYRPKSRIKHWSDNENPSEK